MRGTASSPIHQFLTTVLVVCVSTCCCQAGLVLPGLAGPTAASGCEQATVASCCAETDPSPSNEPSEPSGDCYGCCVKGTGLKDGTVVVPQPLPAATPVLTADATDLLPRWDALASCTPDVRREPFVAPRTLVRLRCALIV